MTQPPAPDWSTQLALSVAHEVRRHRQAQGLSAQQLADRCAEIGMPIQRSVLANLESGRRTTVTIAEVLVLAAALEIPPALLVFPVGRVDKFAMLPDFEANPLAAVDWFGGIRPPDSRHRFSSNALFLYRRHRSLSNQLRQKLAEREDVRATYTVWSAEQEEISTRSEGAKAELEELRSLVIGHRERWRDVPLAERETPPEVTEAKARMEELSDQVVTLEKLKVNLTYSHRHLVMLDERIDQLAMDLEKIRINMQDAGMILPPLRDDVWGVLSEVSKRIAQLPLFDEQQETSEE